MTAVDTAPAVAEASAARRPRVDLVLAIGALVVVGLVVVALLIWPDQAQNGANTVFNASTRIFGAPVQLMGFGCFILAVGLAISRFGKIKLGEGKPEYSTPSWLFMFISAGLGSATMYWAFMEWAYYYQTPGLNIEPESREAMDMGIAYAFFHWGPIAWSMYVVAGISMAYYFHVRRGRRLSYAGNIEAVNGRMRAGGVWGRVIDLLFLFGTFGGLILTVTVTVNTVSAGVSGLAGVEDSFWIKAVILAGSTLVFGLSSFIGIDKGLQKLAKIAVLAAFGFAAGVYIIGPTEFITNNITNGLGLEIQNFVHMSLFTDPNGGGSFTRDWTVFYWLYWISYLPGVAIFIARVSKGRTIRQTVIGLVVGGCAGIMFFFGVLSSYAMNETVNGTVNAPELLTTRGGDFAVAQLLNSLPLGQVFSVVYFVIMLLFLASHMDATSFTVAAVSTRNLPVGTDPARGLRLFWVVMLAAIPMAMLAINANLGTLKTGLTLTAIPFLFLLGMQIVGLTRWLRQDGPRVDPESGLVRPEEIADPAEDALEKESSTPR
ncbi:BCCT family betaine/carnitine transporter [Rhodococcus sp. AG1013]|uniref:BCCT family transporter n=1 Tax=Rhodococcus sp. AG1013 TaxID=2183996 RepID=UPI000E0B0258|nr:BCCT family transporter [Rhodococcus sp. AG1013]RDI23989.1 BCCT family betaine/carnitine transporter [Rhodococcus sp. AG1013]